MFFYGADFSGAKDPSGRICYAKGELAAGKIIIRELVQCDDRLDLFAAIDSSAVPWGIDFPFALPQEAYTALDLSGWPELMDFIVNMRRDEFADLLEDAIFHEENNCRKHSLCCRMGDAAVSGCSPFKKYNPNMRAMLYGGLKILSYLRRSGNNIYPFDMLDKTKSRIYEIYPSHTWRALGLSRSVELKEFADKFYKKTGTEVIIPEEMGWAGSLDAADAVAACATMGCVLLCSDIDNDWDVASPEISAEEWALRLWEGLVVRIC
jgi:hypothetical protein